MKRRIPQLTLLLIAVLFVVGQIVRSEAGLEVSSASIQLFVSDLGWRGPALFLGLVTFRLFLLLPSWVVLAAGGLLFGAVLGTLLGAMGTLLSGLVFFAAGKGIGHDWLRPQTKLRLEGYAERVRATGPWVVGVATAHPFGPMTPFHWAAGFAAVPLVTFALAVVSGGLVRAFLYSFFGAHVLDSNSTEFAVATGLLLLVAVSPLLSRRVRQKLFRRRAS